MPATCPTASWDAVVIADVLYLLPEAQQSALLVGAAARPARAAWLVVKEMGPTPAVEARLEPCRRRLRHACSASPTRSATG